MIHDTEFQMHGDKYLGFKAFYNDKNNNSRSPKIKYEMLIRLKIEICKVFNVDYKRIEKDEWSVYGIL